MSNARRLDDSRLKIAGLWLIGLALLLEFRWMWPGILFLGGATALVRAYYHPERRNAVRGGAVMILIGFWSMMRFSLPVLLVEIGAGLILTSLHRPHPDAKPYVDRILD